MKQLTILRIATYSFVFILFMIAWLHLTVPFLTILFSLLVLEKLLFLKRRWAAACIFVLLVGTILYLFFITAEQAANTLPHVAEKSIPIIISHLKSYGMQLPFENIDELKPLIVKTIREELASVAHVAGIATKGFVLFIIGIVIAISIFIGRTVDLARATYTIKNNVYVALTDELQRRFVAFYQSFKTVMGAQIMISSVNTISTGIFLYCVDIPYAQILVAATFLCGLLPIIGNIISNTIIFCVAITISVQDALFALIFLIVLHKFEYFLNGKIIGHRIGNPMWLTLLGLIVGEQVMGIPGMILAPVALYYLKQECSKIEII